ncbi:MAG TPA: DUF1801 domain-containing protein [Archangium sp.]|uniref:DUF1801 domain-containing protein n=1 Tax=Archangium sp. TaxID=1872627 RepID=UPI002E3220DC|nr:DUF1801 domain-containing protein [Archangium sp.]HEX5751769.1 DUF1801 domain-containing protein [Archangium sp.]
MQSKATTVEQYLASLPEDRRAAVSAVREVILENLDEDYEEGIQYGMLGYYVPHEVFPAGYHVDPKQPLPFAALASQKNHMAVYLMGVYGQPQLEKWFRDAWTKTGRKLDMGKSCVRFKKLEDVALDVLGEAIRRVPAKAYIQQYESVIRPPDKKKAPAAKKSKPAAKKTVARKRA